MTKSKIEVFRIKRRGGYDYGIRSGPMEIILSEDDRNMLINEWDRLPQEHTMSGVLTVTSN